MHTIILLREYRQFPQFICQQQVIRYSILHRVTESISGFQNFFSPDKLLKCTVFSTLSSDTFEPKQMNSSFELSRMLPLGSSSQRGWGLWDISQATPLSEAPVLTGTVCSYPFMLCWKWPDTLPGSSQWHLQVAWSNLSQGIIWAGGKKKKHELL